VSRAPRSVAAALLLAAAALAPRAASAAVPPAPTRWVTDGAGFLSVAARQSLDARLEAYERRTGHQVLVWIGRSTGDEPVEDFTVRAFAAWRVGRKGIDDGLVLFVFSADRKVRIEVGYGLESVVPDAIASRVIRETIAPRLAAGDNDGAIEAGVGALLAAIDGTPASGAATPKTAGPSAGRPPPAPREAPSLSLGQKLLVGLVVLGFVVLFITNPALAIYLLFSILSGGRGGGGIGGGGGYSGGGGRSGGGGATGSW
jgi:uncharacterized protein